jgi:serine/threonine protein phosphatase PrpC
VADGMGGHAYGECVSREALRKVALALCESLLIEPRLNILDTAPPPTRQGMQRLLMSALEQANAHILRMVETNRWPKAGSTLVCALVIGARAVVANLGDSPLFLLRDGVLTQVTEDHTVAGVLLRAGLITPEMARVHEGRGRLEFFAGARELPSKPPLYDLPLEPGDVLLLCSDGVNGTFTPEDMATCFADADLETAADRLLTAAQAAGETDNQTLILWRYQPQEGELAMTEEPEPAPEPDPAPEPEADTLEKTLIVPELIQTVTLNRNDVLHSLDDAAGDNEKEA